MYAPAGKLGVVIDTPDNGAPVVQTVKDTGPVTNRVRVGDKLVVVDNKEVRAMTAIKVSKLISRKSSNVNRKLTLIWHVPVGGVEAAPVRGGVCVFVFRVWRLVWSWKRRSTLSMMCISLF